jgi:hypothetical protein
MSVATPDNVPDAGKKRITANGVAPSFFGWPFTAIRRNGGQKGFTRASLLT